MRKTLDPTARTKDSLDGHISRSVDDHNGQGHQEESEILGNFQLKELTEFREGIQIDQDCERAQSQEGNKEKDIWVKWLSVGPAFGEDRGQG